MKNENIHGQGVLIKENKELKEKIEFYEDIFKNLNAIIYINRVIGEGEMVPEWTSKEANSILGYTKEELQDFNFHASLYHPDDVGIIMDSYKHFVKNKRKELSLVYRVKNKEGKYMWFYSTGTAIEYKEDGTPLRVLAFLINMGEHLKFEKQLHTLLKENKQLKHKLILDRFTKREKETLIQIGEGHPIKKIAEQFHISHHTANGYRKSLLRKTECHSMAELSAFAKDCGLV